MTANKRGGRMSEPHTTTWTPWKLLGLIGTIAAALAIFPAIWTFSDHWMNRSEIEKAMKSHADNDARDKAWTQYGFASNRIEYLDDKQAECDAKRMTQSKLAPADLAICTRFEAKLKAKSSEAADLKAKALEASKEK